MTGHSGTPRLARRIRGQGHTRGAAVQRERLLAAVRAGEPGHLWTPRELAEAGKCSTNTATARAWELVVDGLLADAGVVEGAPRREGRQRFVAVAA